MKYILLVGCLAVCFLYTSHVEAFVITEVMYDIDGSDTDKEWIEIATEGLSEPLASLRLQVGDKKHTLKSNTSGDTLPSGTVCVIAQSEIVFKTTYPSFAGCVFESGFSLTNQSGVIKVVHTTTDEIYDVFEYETSMGGAGDGNTLQRAGRNSQIISGTPSPGIFNEGTGDTSQNQNTNTTDATPATTNPDEPVQMSNPSTDYKIHFAAPTYVYERESLHIPVFITYKSGQKTLEITSGTLYISYGDGTFDVVRDNEFIIKHTYEYASSTVIKMYYYSSSLVSLADAEATIRLDVKPFPLTVAYGAQREIIVTNKGVTDFNLTGFTFMVNKTQAYEAPFGMVIAGGGSVSIPYDTHRLQGRNITLYDKRHKKIASTSSLNSSGEITIAKEVAHVSSAQRPTSNQATLVAEASGEEVLNPFDFAPAREVKNSKENNVGILMLVFGFGILVSFGIEKIIQYIAIKKSPPEGSDSSADTLVL